MKAFGNALSGRICRRKLPSTLSRCIVFLGGNGESKLGWRGALRSFEAAARAANRESQRRQKIALKAHAVASAAEAVRAWEHYVENLTHVPDASADAIDWKGIKAAPPPKEPIANFTRRDSAREALNRFTPGFFDFLQGGSDRKRQRLNEAVDHAAARDAADFASAKAAYALAFSEWEGDAALAGRVLRGEPGAFRQVVDEAKLFANSEGFFGKTIAFQFGENFVHAVPNIHATDIIPATQLKQTASGKLSEVKMSVSRANELYQDYVAGVALRLANDILRILPIDEMYITCQTTMLNAKSGHQEPTPVLSVQVVRATLDRLDLRHVDPSDAFANFHHAMKFRKATGLERITPLKPVPEVDQDY